MAEYCIRGRNRVMPPSQTGTETLAARGRPARKISSGTAHAATRNTVRYVGENAEKSVWAGMTVSLPGSSSGPSASAT